MKNRFLAFSAWLRQSSVVRAVQVVAVIQQTSDLDGVQIIDGVVGCGVPLFAVAILRVMRERCAGEFGPDKPLKRIDDLRCLRVLGHTREKSIIAAGVAPGIFVIEFLIPVAGLSLSLSTSGRGRFANATSGRIHRRVREPPIGTVRG